MVPEPYWFHCAVSREAFVEEKKKFWGKAFDHYKAVFSITSDAALGDRWGVSREMISQMRRGVKPVPVRIGLEVLDKVSYRRFEGGLLAILGGFAGAEVQEAVQKAMLNARTCDEGMRILDKFRAGSPETCIVKKSAFADRAIFFTEKDGFGCGCAIPVVSSRGEKPEDVVWAEYSEFRLSGEMPSSTLRVFIKWLKDAGIEKFEVRGVADGELHVIERQMVVLDSQVLDKDEETEKVRLDRENLRAWTQ